MEIEVSRRTLLVTGLLVGVVLIASLFLLAPKNQGVNASATKGLPKITTPEIPLSIRPGFMAGPIKVGEKAPDFEVTTIEGKKISLRELTASKKPVLIFFSAIWCSSCKATLEASKAVYPKYKDRVLFLDISIDLTENGDVIKSFKERNGYPAEFALANRDVLINYKILSTSTKYGIRDGVIVYSDVGPLTEKYLEEAFQKTIGE